MSAIEIAQELLQDLFLKIWEYRESINTDKSFKSFLYKVAENLVFGHFRKVAKEERLTNRLVLVSTELSDSPEDRLIDNENHALLKKAIERIDRF